MAVFAALASARESQAPSPPQSAPGAGQSSGEKHYQGGGSAALGLAAWQRPASVMATPFELGEVAPKFAIWGGGGGVRHYFDDLLPALFERTLELEKLDAKSELVWMFTGERGGCTITVTPHHVELVERHYDSPAFNEMAGGKPPRHPEWKTPAARVEFTGVPHAVTVRYDHKFGLSVALNGREALRRFCALDLSRHQLRCQAGQGVVRGKLLIPQAEQAKVIVDPAQRHQTMVGFGGIAAPTAYAQLSVEGKRRWWQMVCEYNLLIQREYPAGQMLNEAMDNWDRLDDAVPHYYGDNFPNGEISDFEYIKMLRRQGGMVWFEFWKFPRWLGNDIDRYTEAMVRYCQVSKDKAGAPPEVVGIQNEVGQSPAQWQKMTLALRAKLDAAGFKSVRIHMSDDGRLAGGIKRAETFRHLPEVWAAIDYAATHMYDYQNHFTDPDGFDALLGKWKEAVGDKPFLSTELCINHAQYQLPGYHPALTMGQLYHKNLVLADAAAICYCWTLLNVEQPSYGWSRTLCVPDPAGGFVPKAASHQLRVFGAYSRRIREGMIRVDAKTDDVDLLVSAFDGNAGARTLVLLNRSTKPKTVEIVWPQAKFATLELTDPYHQNEVRNAPEGGHISIEPGAIVTLSTAPLGSLKTTSDDAQ